MSCLCRSGEGRKEQDGTSELLEKTAGNLRRVGVGVGYLEKDVCIALIAHLRELFRMMC